MIDSSQHTTTKHLKVEKTLAGTVSKLFRTKDQVNNALCEVDPAKPHIGQNELTIELFSITKTVNVGIRLQILRLTFVIYIISFSWKWT